MTRRVRQAINFATDRAVLVEPVRRSPGRRSDLPDRADRIPGLLVLLSLPGNPSRGGGWTAPDLERARRLVAASGRAGTSVTVDVGVEEHGAPAPTSSRCCATWASMRGCT